MKRSILVCVATLALCGSALAQDKQQKPMEHKPMEHKPAGAAAQAPGQAPAMDMTKMGPAARKPTNEKQTKKEIEEFFKKQEELGKKGDFEGALAGVDYPVYMVTDDLKGVPETKEFSREEYAAMMKPFYENMPKDMKMTHKPTISVISDSLAVVIDDFTMTMGKQKITGRNASLLVKRDGQWKWKSMVEAGYGDMPAADANGGMQKPAEGKK